MKRSMAARLTGVVTLESTFRFGYELRERVAVKLDWRELIYYKSRNSGGRNSYGYLLHLEEAFTACLEFIREHHPNATLNHLGSDLGGEIYRVEEEE